MNRYMKERLKTATLDEIKKQDEEHGNQHREDVAKFPELFSQNLDDYYEMSLQAKGISPLPEVDRQLIKSRLTNGEYPNRLIGLAKAELALKNKDI
jgi:hypothetical protein